MDNSAAEMLIIFSQSLPNIQTFVFLVFGAIGVGLVGNGISTYFLEGGARGRAGQTSVFTLLMKVFFGSFCLSLPWITDTVAGSFFSEPDSLFVDSGVSADSDISAAVLMTLVNLMAIIGYITVGRGLLELANGPVNKQPGWVGKGITFIVVGAILTNFYVFANYVANSFGMGALGTEYFRF